MAFLLRQWLRERASVLFTYIAYLVSTFLRRKVVILASDLRAEAVRHFGHTQWSVL